MPPSCHRPELVIALINNDPRKEHPMALHTIIAMMLVCFLVSSPVWVQGGQPVCPCWSAEQLEMRVSICIKGTAEGRLRTEPGTSQTVEAHCQAGFHDFFARISFPLEPPNPQLPVACEFHLRIEELGVNINTRDEPAPPEGEACRSDLIRVCRQLHP